MLIVYCAPCSEQSTAPNPTVICQECFELLDESNSSNHQHLAISGFPLSDHTDSKFSADHDSLWNTAKQASRHQVFLKTQPPICLDYSNFEF